MDQSDDEFFSPIYMLKKVLAPIIIEYKALAASKKIDREEKKTTKERK